MDRLWIEVTEVEARLERGLECCHEFESHPNIVECAHSDSKWLSVDATANRGRADSVIRALQRNNTVVHIDCIPAYLTKDEFLAIARKVTSLRIFGAQYQIADDVQLPPNILSIEGRAAMSQEHQDALERNRSQLGDRTTIEFTRTLLKGRALVLHGASTFTIRFLGPPTGFLTLQLVYRATAPDIYLTVGEFKHPVPHSDRFVRHDIKIWPRPSSELSFTPNSRNALTFRATGDSIDLYDIEMLDTAGNPCRWKSGDHGDVLEESMSATTSEDWPGSQRS
jgi:hypothetical protein